jgi:death-on-curing protein
MDPMFLTIHEIIAIHEDQVNRYGGTHGIRDEDLLLSAAGMPEIGFGGEYLHHDLFEMAAAYLFHLVMDHPFIDGNKRVGTAAARVFLRLNGCDVPMSDDEIYDLVIAVTEGRAGKSEVADAFREASVPLP